MNEIEEKKQALIDILNDICDHAINMDEREMTVFYNGYDYALRHTKLTRCKDCRYFANVTPNPYQKLIRVCIKGHNGYETFGCTEGEPENVQD